VTTVFSQQDGIYGFKFLKRFLEIFCRDLTLFTLFSIESSKDLITNPTFGIDAFSLCIREERSKGKGWERQR